MGKRKNKHLFGIFFAILGAVLWGVDGIVSQFLFQRTPINLIWLIGIRMFVSGILLLVIAYFLEGSAIFNVWREKGSIFAMLLYAIVGLSGDQLTYSMAINVSTAAMATILQSLSVVFVVIFSAFIFRQFPNGLRWLAIVMATLGTWLLVTKGSFNHIELNAPTLAWGLAFAVCAALNNVLPVKLVASFGSFPVMGWGMLIGGLIFGCFHPIWVGAPHFTLPTFAGIAFTSIVGTGLAYVIFVTSLKYITATEATVLNTFEPLTAVVLGFLFMGLQLNWAEILGAVLILATTVILAFDNQSASSQKKRE